MSKIPLSERKERFERRRKGIAEELKGLATLAETMNITTEDFENLAVRLERMVRKVDGCNMECGLILEEEQKNEKNSRTVGARQTGEGG